MKQYYVYILASQRNGTLYIGLTGNLAKRVYEHKIGLVEGFTSKYKVHRLVYYETYSNIYDAVAREKRMKKWKRQWKIQLIEETNPQWQDLSHEMLDGVDSRFRGNDSETARITERGRELQDG